MTGATAANVGLSNTVVLALVVAFETAALWWLYFAEAAEHSRRRIATSDDAGRLARDAYTYLHLPIVAGIIAVAVGDDLLIKDTGSSLSTAGALMVLGGPAIYLLGESLFRLRHDRLGEPQAHRHRRPAVRAHGAQLAADGARADRRRHRGRDGARHLGGQRQAPPRPGLAGTLGGARP